MIICQKWSSLTSEEILTINTHKRLFQYQRFPVENSAAPASVEGFKSGLSKNSKNRDSTTALAQPMEEAPLQAQPYFSVPPWCNGAGCDWVAFHPTHKSTACAIG